MACKLIIYACPVGDLALQLESYFQRVIDECGRNTAHKYMPHCTLTGFFHDDASAIPIYQSALDTAWNPALSTDSPVEVAVESMTFEPDFHYLKLESDTLLSLVAKFASLAQSPTRRDELRLKTWLHLSLAYDFNAEHGKQLRTLARETIEPGAPVDWELRLYECHPDWSWTCHLSRVSTQRG